MKNIVVFMIAVSLLIPALSFAKKVKYEVVEVKNGGVLKGKIKAAIKVNDPLIPIEVKPKGDPEETELEKHTCGNSQQSLMYVLSPSLEVNNVLVIVEDIMKGKAAPKIDLTIDNLNCRFVPLVGISYIRSEYIIKNNDPIFHSIALALIHKNRKRTVYNLALPFKDQIIRKDNRVAGLHKAGCAAHPWTRAYIYSSTHPYVAITDANGTYEIKDLLPGKYKVRVWHEGFEEVVKNVEIKTGKASYLNVTFKKLRKLDL